MDLINGGTSHLWGWRFDCCLHPVCMISSCCRGFFCVIRFPKTCMLIRFRLTVEMDDWGHNIGVCEKDCVLWCVGTLTNVSPKSSGIDYRFPVTLCRLDGWMHVWMGGWMGGWVGGWVDWWLDGWVGGLLVWWIGWMHGWKDRQMNKWMAGQTDGSIQTFYSLTFKNLNLCMHSCITSHVDQHFRSSQDLPQIPFHSINIIYNIISLCIILHCDASVFFPLLPSI